VLFVFLELIIWI